MKSRSIETLAVLSSLLLFTGCDTDLGSLDELLLKSGPLNGRSPAELGLPFEEARFAGPDGNQLVGWFVPATRGTARATALIHTGMQGSLVDYLPTLPWFADNDFNVLVYDWRGFGDSEGDRRFINFEDDANAAVHYLISRPEPSAHVLIQFGVSLGASPALASAAKFPDKTVGVIVYGALDPNRLPTDYMVTQLSPLLAPLGEISGAFFGAIATPYLGPLNHLQGVQAPILAVIAEDDQIVPPTSQLALFDLYPEPKQIIYTFGGHVRAHKTDPQLGAKIISWAEQLDGLLPVE